MKLNPELLTPTEAAAFARMSLRTFQRRIQEGAGPRQVKNGRVVLFRVRDIKEWLNGGQGSSGQRRMQGGLSNG